MHAEAARPTLMATTSSRDLRYRGLTGLPRRYRQKVQSLRQYVEK